MQMKRAVAILELILETLLMILEFRPSRMQGRTKQENHQEME